MFKYLKYIDPDEDLPGYYGNHGGPGENFPWSWSQRTCLTLLCYAARFCFGSENGSLDDIIRHLDALAAYCSRHESTGKRPIEKSHELNQVFVKSLQRSMENFSSVPKQNHLPEPTKRNERLALFINFLFQILIAEEEKISDVSDPIQKELTFLLTFLGDASFECSDELQEVEHLLLEFEM